MLAFQRARRHPWQGAHIIKPKPNPLAALCQVGAQAPTHANIAKVINHTAENIPQQPLILRAHTIGGGRWARGWGVHGGIVDAIFDFQILMWALKSCSKALTIAQ